MNLSLKYTLLCIVVLAIVNEFIKLMSSNNDIHQNLSNKGFALRNIVNNNINKEWNMNTCPNKPVYTLGDIVRDQFNWKLNEYRLNHPKSIATEYLEKTKGLDRKKAKNSVDIVSEIVKQRNSPIDIAHDVVIHVRGGDVMQTNTMFEKGHRYVFSKCYYDQIARQLPKGSKILIVSSECMWLHENATNANAKTPEIARKNTRIYIDQIVNFFVNNKFFVSVRLNHNPDDDFILMAKAKCFVPSGGGYSRLIRDVRTYLNLPTMRAYPECGYVKHIPHFTSHNSKWDSVEPCW